MKNKSHDFLLDWAVNYARNKDSISKKIESIEKEKDGFDLLIRYKDKAQYFMIMPAIDINFVLQKLKNDVHVSIVTLNSKENLDALLKNWGRLANFKFLNVIFANPFSELDKRWIIFPHTHNKICDESSLEAGLRSMFEMVEPIEEAQLISKIG